MRPVSRRHSRRGLVGGSTFRKTPISPSKSLGARTKLNMARAAMNALKSIKTVEEVAALRGKTVEEILG